MTVTEKDIYASAKIFLEQHGDEALSKATEMIGSFEAKGDVEGRECWNQIAGVIKWMSEDGNNNETIN